MMADALTQHLGELTVWGDGTQDAPMNRGEVWRRALAAMNQSNMESRPVKHARRRPGPGKNLRVPATVMLILVVIGVVMFPALGKARNSAVMSPRVSGSWATDIDGSGQSFQDPTILGQWESSPNRAGTTLSGASSLRSGNIPETAARHVVRRATMQLESDDVRAAFTLAKQLVSPARGEYVESADIRERNTGYEADLVLRVEADRLDEVLIELRGLGTVINDRIDTDDVTNRVVDIEARLRNERVVETELLGLLANRENDDLQGVLNVRRELASVRQQIEVMLAQRNQIARLVSLSTITVILREPEAEPEPVEERSAWSDFTDSVGEAWRAGLRSLGEFITGLLWFAVAGLPVWILIAAISAFVWRKYRILNPKPLPE